MKHLWVLLAIFFLALQGCSGGRQQSSAAASEQSFSPASAPITGDVSYAKNESSEKAAVTIPKKIIYTGNVSLVAENLDKAGDALEQRVKQFGGYIGDASKTGTRDQVRTASWTIRIPSTSFDSFLKAVSQLGELESMSTTAQDVSEEFYDVAARLKNKKVEEQRLIELLQKATGKLSEVLTVEKELSRVREEVEQIEGRLRFLTNQTDLSTITIMIREVKDFKPQGPPTFATKISRRFSGSLEAIKNTGEALVLFVVGVGPWLIIFALLGLLFKKLFFPKPKSGNELKDESINQP
jgi:hypothetical protein